MKLQSPAESLLLAQGIAPATLGTGTAQTASVDTSDCDELLVVLNVGTATATGTMDVVLQDSADDSTFADITGTDFTQVDVNNDNTVYVGRLLAKNFKQYVRAEYVVGTDTVDAGLTFIRVNNRDEPVTQAETIAFDVTI